MSGNDIQTMAEVVEHLANYLTNLDMDSECWMYLLEKADVDEQMHYLLMAKYLEKPLGLSK